MKSYSSTTNLMLKAAEKAYNTLQRDFREIEVLQSSKRGPTDFALKTLEKVQSLVIEILSMNPKFRNYFDLDGNFLYGEEGEGFFVGIDGMLNFEHSIPYFSVVIGSVNKESKLDSAIVFCPGLLEYYIVERGKGAWKEPISGFGNSMRLKVSERQYKNKVLASGRNNEDISEMGLLNFNAESISIAYVASGKLDYHYLSDKPFFNLLSTLFINEVGGVMFRDQGKTIISNRNLLNDNKLQLV